MMTSDEFSNDAELIGDLKVLLSVKNFPIRIKCALLACNAIDDGIKKIRLKEI